MRLTPTAKDPYVWNFLPEAAHLFSRNLSKHGVAACQQLMTGIGRSFEAVSKCDWQQPRLVPKSPKSSGFSPNAHETLIHVPTADHRMNCDTGIRTEGLLDDETGHTRLENEVSSLRDELSVTNGKAEYLEKQLSHALATVSSHEASDFRSQLTLGHIAELIAELRQSNDDNYYC